MNPQDLRAVGVVVGVHGLQGTLRLNPLSDFAERFAVLRTIYLKRDDEIIGSFTVTNVRWTASQILMNLKQIETRDEAEKLRGVEICVPEKDAWKLPSGVFYSSDLIGFTAVTAEGETLGILRTIYSGAQDIFEFERDGENLLVPFVDDWVGEVDMNRRTIEIRHWKALLNPDEIEKPKSSHDH